MHSFYHKLVGTLAIFFLHQTTQDYAMTSSTSTLSDSRGRNLATFRSASEWATWKVKAQAYFVRKGLYGIITDTRPTEMKQVPTTTTEKNMWEMNERVVRARARSIEHGEQCHLYPENVEQCNLLL